MCSRNWFSLIWSSSRINRSTRTVFMLALAALFFAAPFQSPAADSTAFDYGDVASDVSDLSFYEAPPESFEPVQRPEFGDARVKNVILMIGDGMAPAQVQLARLRALGADGKLFMERLPVLGLMRTHSANALVTDSAAAGTALACGIKTRNGMIGMSPDKTKYTTLIEFAQQQGRRTGLVATSRISHATPATFASHVPSRKQEREIAAQILKGKINVLFGGGRDYWRSENRDDGRDLLDEAAEMGYEVVGGLPDMQAAEGEHVLGLFTEGPMETQPPEPMISEMTAKAVELLKESEDGFFLMVEGSQIDWAGHANNADNNVRQTLLFDQAVAAAVLFAETSGDTLVIVTSDHECGGLTVFGKDDARWSSGGHSALDVQVYAYGPGAEGFAGVLDNTELAKRIARLMGVVEFPQAIEE